MVVSHLYDALHHDIDQDHHSMVTKPGTGWSHVRDTVHGTAHFRLAMVSGKRKRLALKALIVISCGCIGVIPFEWMLKQDAQCSRIANFANYLFAIATAFMAAGVVRPRASAARARVRARANPPLRQGRQW